MADAHPDTPVQPSAMKRLVFLAGGVLVVLLVLLLGVRVLVATPPGRALVERSLDGMGLGALGTLEVAGLEGDPLGRLRIARLAIVDEEGVWIEAEDIALHWRPGSLLHHIAYVEDLRAERLHLVRRPDLGDGSNGGERTWGFALDTLHLPQIELDQAVLGAAAVLAMEASVDAEPDRSLTVEMSVERTDVAGDMLTVSGAISPQGHGDLDIELVAPAEGPIARLIRLPSQTLRAQAMLTGDLGTGEGRIDATLGDLPFVVATGQWSPDGAALNLTAQLSVAPELAALAQRLGPELNANLIVGAPEDGRRSIALDASADGALLRAAGPVDVRRRSAPEGLQATFATPRLSRLIGEGVLDRASFGPVEASGRLTFGEEIAFLGDINGGALAFDDWSAGQASGPVSIAWSEANARVEADLTTSGVQAPAALGGALGEAPEIAAVVAYDYGARQLTVSDARILAAAGEAIGEASWTLDGGPLSLRAAATISDASHLPRLAGGTGTVSLTLAREAAGAPIRIEVSGAGQDLVAASPTLSDLLGASASVDAAFDVADGGARIERASLQGERLMIEARGGVARATGYDLDVDIALQGPVAAGPFDLDGGANAAARLEGAYEAPTLRLDLRADALAAGPVALTAPRLRAELADVFRAPSGTLAFDAVTLAGPAALSTQVSYVDGVLAARAIEGGWRDFRISGEASRGPDTPPRGALTLGGLGGRLAVDVRMAMEDGPPRLDLHATLRDQPIADAGVISGLSVSVVGPLDALDLAASARGYAGSEFSFEASGSLVRADGETRLTLAPRGMIGSDAVSAPRPWTAAFRSGDAAIAAALNAGGGALDVRVDRRNGVTEVAVDLADAPLSLINLFRPDPALEGRASGSIALRGSRTLEGTTRFTIADARAPDYAPDEHLDASLDLTHGADGADIAFTATDGDDFRARIGGRAPLVVAAWPPIPRRDRDATVSLSGEATGDIAALWALAAVPGVVVSGRVDASGSLDGTLRAPAFQGAVSVEDGGVEEVRIGLLLTDLQGSVRMQGPRLIVENAQATDGAEGRVTANGEIEFGGESTTSRTRVNVDLAGLRVIHTTDNEAVASGALMFERDATGARLSGDLTIDRASITPPRGGDGAVAVPILDVVEINRPLDLAPPPGARRSAVGLDIKATSQRRVFIRSNSLDTEWAFDVTIGGTTAEPRVEGTASLVRGAITLVGEAFEFRQSQIYFDGDPRMARIDFTAQNESADLTVTARVTGTAEKPEIALSSSPSYPQDEVLARMLFGRTRSDLSPFEAAQLASALASLAGGQGFDLLGPLRQTLGVDRLGVDSVDGRALLSGGRYLSEDVYLEVSGGATGLAEAAIEWEIMPRLELATRFGIAQDTTVSIRWRKDY